MDSISTMEAAARWGMHPRVVQGLCKAGRIPGARKYGRVWMIPADAPKPADLRRAKARAAYACAERPAYRFLIGANLPRDGADAALGGMEAALRPLAAADIAFRRGDPAPAKAVWHETGDEDETKLSAASLASAAAISSGDYALYGEIQRFLQGRADKTQNEHDKALLSLPATLAAVSMALPDITPDWLKACDFSLFPADLRPFLLYLYALHLRNTGAYAELRGIARAALTLSEKRDTFTWLDVYLGVLAASASYALGDAAEAEQSLLSAMALGLPHGFIMPFADSLGDFGGLTERCLSRFYPQYREAVTEAWERSFKNWVRFHNAFSKANITTILTPREYHVARLLASGESYAEVSRRMHLSVGRVKNVQSAVYAKLHVGKRSELKDYIL